MTDAIPAATLVIFRKTHDGAPELLMVERSRSMVFAGGALVFRGGRVDPGDHRFGGDDDRAARVAAIRETIEETGLAIGLDPMPTPDVLDEIRRALHAGQDFAAALAAAGIGLNLDMLEPFARWRPAHAHARIFDTRFYLARLPDGAPPARVDQTENVRLLWASARAVLAEAEAGRAHVIFPTRRNLERLAGFADFAEAVADARRHGVGTITPWIETDRDGVRHLRIPDDMGYPVVSEPVSDAQRG